jgi:ribonuclease HI
MLIEVYSDGSGNTFDSDGGYGWRLVVDGVLISEGNGYLVRATNNVAEITAAIEGLKAASAYISNTLAQPTNTPKVVLISDSQLVLGYASGRYKCKALHLAPLYIQLRKIYGSLGADTRWVKGHNGDEHNEGCDKLAKAARNSKGQGISGAPAAIAGTDNSLGRDEDGGEA